MGTTLEWSYPLPKQKQQIKNKLLLILRVVVNYVIDRLYVFYLKPYGFFSCPRWQRFDINFFDMFKCIHIYLLLLIRLWKNSLPFSVTTVDILVPIVPSDLKYFVVRVLK